MNNRKVLQTHYSWRHSYNWLNSAIKSLVLCLRYSYLLSFEPDSCSNNIWNVLHSLMQAEEVVDKAVKEAINKPWLPLPIGLKPPSMDSVLDELSKQGIPFSKKSKDSRPCWLVHDSNGSHQTVLVTFDGGQTYLLADMHGPMPYRLL